MNVIERIKETKIVPVVKLEDAAKAVELADALAAGGICCAEVTFRTAAAGDAIAAITRARPDFFVGAGTVVNTEQAKRAIDAGAQFLVSPGFSEKLAAFCADHGAAFLPGVCTPTEVMAAMEFGLDHLKFFPAEAMGGLKTIKALAGPFGGVKFMPTGGINVSNVRSYLESPFIYACGGSWMVPGVKVKENDWAGITALTREASDLVADL